MGSYSGVKTLFFICRDDYPEDAIIYTASPDGEDFIVPSFALVEELEHAREKPFSVPIIELLETQGHEEKGE